MEAEPTYACAHVPEQSAEQRAALPAWVAPLLLAGLTVVSGLIVLVGWLIVKPSPGIVEPIPEVHISERVPAPPMVSEKPLIPDEEPITVEEVTPPAAKIALRRRTPSGAEESPPLIVAPKPPPSDEKPRTMAPLVWTTEAQSNLMMPIEVAKIDDGVIPHTVRRLQFPEAPTPLKLAVTPIMHDDLGSMLTKMGEGYRFTNIRNEDLQSFEKLRNYDVVFLTCADLYARDMQAAVPLRKFVEQGGTLYASDLRGDQVLAAFPEYRARMPVLPGIAQNIETSVVDRGLQTYLGHKTIPLNFDISGWRPAGFEPSKVTVCLQGVYRNNLGQAWPVPLLVKFRAQKGTVIFTSFHHAKNDTEIVRKLLEYLVFSAINARSENRVKDLMQRSKFAPKEMRPLLLNAESKIEAAYDHAGGGLQIAVGFENLGAKLKLTLRSPMGQTIDHEGQGVYQVEIPNAEKGVWRYTISAVELPHANFPIIVAIGSAKS